MVNFFRWTAILGGVFGFYMALQQPIAWWLTRDWVSVPAIVTYADIDYSNSRRGGLTHRAVLAYDYSVEGRSYSGYRAMLTNMRSSFGLPQKQSLLRSEGAPLDIWVNPKQPAQSIASRQIIWSEVGSSLTFGLIWLLVVSWMGTLKRPKPKAKTGSTAEIPGYVVTSETPPWLKTLGIACMISLPLAGGFVWYGLQNIQEAPAPMSQRKKQEEARVKSINQKLIANLPSSPADFALQDGNWAFVVLGSGTIARSEHRFNLRHDGLRILQRADCPSDACRPIRSIQWLLVVPEIAAEPDGKWRTVAKARPQYLQFSPALRNDQHLLAPGQVQLQVIKDHAISTFDPQQAYLMAQLTSDGGITTYSRSQLLWGAAPQAAAVVASKAAGSLYAALYYADAQATRAHLQSGASVRERYENDASAVHVAAFSGCTACLEALKEAGADLNDKVSTFRHETPLMKAIRNQQVQAAHKLIELGANPCVTDREGYDAKGWVNFYKLEAKFPFIAACAK